MAQVLHGCATTTEAVRRAIQHSQESLRTLASRYGVNPKTIAKWRNRTSVADLPTGPKQATSTVLSPEQETIVVAFRRHTLLPLDDCLYALQATIPSLTRSSLHRCLQRHGIGRLPEVDGDKAPKKRFKAYPIGFFHIDIAEVQTEQGRLYLFVAIDRTSKFAFTQLHSRATTRIAGEFLRALVKAVPYKVHTVLTDNGIHFTDPKGGAWNPTEIRQMLADKQLFRAHAFEYACALLDIDHRLTKPAHPWTNGQVERMNRTIKEATVRRFHYETHQQLERHLVDFVNAYNFARRLKRLKGLTPYEFICKAWQSQPQLFNLNPLHQMPGLNNYIAQHGFDVYSIDLPGYGRSTRVAAMDQPADQGQPVETTADAVRDYSAVVDWVLARRRLDKVDVVGWSWGTTIAGGYAAEHPDRVNRLVLYAPVWLPTPPAPAGDEAPKIGAYRMVTRDAALQRWLNGVPADKQADLIPPGWFDAWQKATWATDPKSAGTNPPALRASNGVMLDFQRYWAVGRPTYDPSKITAPTLMIQAEWDHDTPPARSQGLFPMLTHAAWKQYVLIGEGTHSVMMEKNRMQLFAAVQNFLEAPSPQ